MVKLTHVQQKLLKKVDLLNFGDNNLRMNEVIRKYHLKDSKEYRQYNSLSKRVQQLVAFLRTLPAQSHVRIQITKDLLSKLYSIGLIQNARSLEECERCGVSAFCKRRITTVLKRLKMAQHTEHAVDLVTHGHIRCGSEVVRDPAMLVTREMEDLITWSNSSKYRQHIAEFNQERDDYDLHNC